MPPRNFSPHHMVTTFQIGKWHYNCVLEGHLDDCFAGPSRGRCPEHRRWPVGAVRRGWPCACPEHRRWPVGAVRRGWPWHGETSLRVECRAVGASERGGEPSARDRGSSPGSRLWPASAADSPPCSRDDTPSPSSSAGGAGCGGRAGIIALSAATYVVFGWSSVGSLRPPMMSRSRPISLPARARRRRRSRREEDRFQ